MKKFLIRLILIILGLLITLILFVAVAFMLASFKGFCGWFAMSLFAGVMARGVTEPVEVSMGWLRVYWYNPFSGESWIKN